MLTVCFCTFAGSLSPVPQKSSSVRDTGSHMSNSVTQFCSVLTGTMTSTQWASVCRRNTSTNAMTCSVLPRPMLCARIQPRPLLVWYRCSDSTTLSYRNRIPPIFQHTKTRRHYTYGLGVNSTQYKLITTDRLLPLKANSHICHRQLAPLQVHSANSVQSRQFWARSTASVQHSLLEFLTLAFEAWLLLNL